MIQTFHLVKVLDIALIGRVEVNRGVGDSRFGDCGGSRPAAIAQKQTNKVDDNHFETLCFETFQELQQCESAHLPLLCLYDRTILGLTFVLS